MIYNEDQSSIPEPSTTGKSFMHFFLSILAFLSLVSDLTVYLKTTKYIKQVKCWCYDFKIHDEGYYEGNGSMNNRVQLFNSLLDYLLVFK